MGQEDYYKLEVNLGYIARLLSHCASQSSKIKTCATLLRLEVSSSFVCYCFHMSSMFRNCGNGQSDVILDY